MKVKLLKPSISEAELLKSTDPNEVIEVKPRRWSAKQQQLTVLPIEVVSNDGEVLDSGILNVHQRTGKISFTKVGGAGVEIECDADKPVKKKGGSL